MNSANGNPTAGAIRDAEQAALQEQDATLTPHTPPAPTVTREQLHTLIAAAASEGWRANRAWDEQAKGYQAELMALNEQQQAIEARRAEIQKEWQQANDAYTARELPRRGMIDAWEKALAQGGSTP